MTRYFLKTAGKNDRERIELAKTPLIETGCFEGRGVNDTAPRARIPVKSDLVEGC
jgi:hypothetical protein